jgi:hypothetical protein
MFIFSLELSPYVSFNERVGRSALFHIVFPNQKQPGEAEVVLEGRSQTKTTGRDVKA